MAFTVGGFYLGSAVIARHRAQAAADLAALAAAARLTEGVEAACGQATAIAHEMRVGLADCAVDGLDVVVTITCRAGARRRTGWTCRRAELVVLGLIAFIFLAPLAFSRLRLGLLFFFAVVRELHHSQLVFCR